jgi:metal-responsive CopG/Arc/MetJ family transcriptional regulator
MRATIDLPDHLRAAVMGVAARKGYRGYSKVIIEALEFYLVEKESKETGFHDLLSLRGAWSKKEASEVRARIEEARTNWQETDR